METSTKWIIGIGAAAATAVVVAVVYEKTKKPAVVAPPVYTRIGGLGGVQKIVQNGGGSAPVSAQSYALAPNVLIPPVFQKYAGIFTILAPFGSYIAKVVTTGGATAIGAGSQTQLLLTNAPATATVTWSGGTTVISFA